MLYGLFRSQVKEVGHHRSVGKAAEREGRHELCSALSEDGINLCASLRELTGQVCCFICGYAAGHAQQNGLAF